MDEVISDAVTLVLECDDLELRSCVGNFLKKLLYVLVRVYACWNAGGLFAIVQVEIFI